MSVSVVAVSRRREFLARTTAIAVNGSFSTQARSAQSTPLRLGQSVSLSGPQRDLGIDEVERATANARGFIEDKSIFGLFTCQGTPIVQAMMPLVLESGIPLFAPFSGAALASPPGARNVFNIRAGYADEVEKLIGHLTTIGIRRVAVACLGNAFGKEILEAAQRELAHRRLKEIVVIPVGVSGADAGAAAKAVAASQPEALLMGLAGWPAIRFVGAIRAERRGLPLYALSVLGSAATLKAMGDDGVGIVISQVVPLPTDANLPLVREFQSAWKAAGVPLDTSHLALEGYVNAKAFAAILARLGRRPSRLEFIDAAWRPQRYDIGGVELNFSRPGRSASRFVELTLVRSGGRFAR